MNTHHLLGFAASLPSGALASAVTAKTSRTANEHDHATGRYANVMAHLTQWFDGWGGWFLSGSREIEDIVGKWWRKCGHLGKCLVPIRFPTRETNFVSITSCLVKSYGSSF